MGAPAGRMDREVMAEVATALLRGKPENARAVLLANTSMTPSEVDQTLQSLTPQVEKYKAQVQAAADSAAHYTAMAMWTIFLGMLIAMVAAAIGGWLGAGHIHRVHHLRRYETTRSKAL
jgi:cell division protein FtsX